MIIRSLLRFIFRGRPLAFTFASALLFQFSAVGFGQAETRIGATWKVVKYGIQVDLPRSETERALTVRSTIDVVNVSGRPANSLTLRLSPDADIRASRINGTPVEGTKGQEKAGTATMQRVAFRIPAVQANGKVAVVLEYMLPTPENSGLRSVTPAGTHFLPLSFWYPTPNSWFFARGADHAPFEIRVNDSTGRSVISAGTEASGTFETRLNSQPFFVTGDWDRTEAEGIAVLAPKGIGPIAQERGADLAKLASEARAFTAGLLGTAPNDPIRIVGVRRGGGFASGGTLLIDEGAFRRTKLDAGTAMNIAEGVVRLWIGDLVAVSDDGAGVVTEGLTRYIATKFIESRFGEDVAEIERMRQRTAYTSVARRDGPLSRIVALDDFYYSATGNKGAMVWRLLERRVGSDEFYGTLRRALENRTTTLAEIRSGFSSQKQFLDYLLDEVTDLNLMIGLPQASGGEAKVALRNAGAIDVTVNVEATLKSGQRMSAPATIRAKSFGEIIFKTNEEIVRVEIDPEKLYPQTDYSDDVAPRIAAETDLLLAVKRDFDRQNFTQAEATARSVLRDFPRFDDVRVLLARSLLAQNKFVEAETEFQRVLGETMPTARSIAWAHVGLGETAARTGRSDEAVRHAESAIRAEGEVGAGMAARQLRNRVRASSSVDEGLRNFFAQFDRAAVSARKTELEALVVPGEVPRFTSGITGQATEWRTQVNHADMLDANTALVETQVTAKLLLREPESGMAVYRMVRSGGGWKLAGIEIFEVR